MRVLVHEGPDEIAALREDWRALESRGLEDNAYLSARFVLPALDCLSLAAPVWLLTAWDDPPCGGRTLRGLGIFHSAGPRSRFPVMHVSAYCSGHSFLGGLLLDAEQARPALHAILDALARRTGGLRLNRLNAAGATARLLRCVVTERGASFHDESLVQRACLSLDQGHATGWREHVPASRLRSLERHWRKLREAGEPAWRYLRGEAVSEMTIERFLALEHAGWKGRQRSSLRADPRQEAFFRQMALAFRADGEMYFTEVLLDDRVIASTCNLRAGSDGFAFKVAYDPSFSKYGPGLLNELGFLKALEQGVDRFRSIDSGSEPGSFIEEFWPGRRTLYSGSIALGRLSRTAARASEALVRVRRRLLPAAGPGPLAAG